MKSPEQIKVPPHDPVKLAVKQKQLVFFPFLVGIFPFSVSTK
jgi:hypothetical protein